MTEIDDVATLDRLNEELDFATHRCDLGNGPEPLENSLNKDMFEAASAKIGDAVQSINAAVNSKELLSKGDTVELIEQIDALYKEFNWVENASVPSDKSNPLNITRESVNAYGDDGRFQDRFTGERYSLEDSPARFSESCKSYLSSVTTDLSALQHSINVGPNSLSMGRNLSISGTGEANALNTLGKAFNQVTKSIDVNAQSIAPTLDKEIAANSEVVKAFGQVLVNLDNSIQKAGKESDTNVLTKDAAKEILENLQLQKAQLETFSKMLTAIQQQLPKNVFQYVFGGKDLKPPTKALISIIGTFADTVRELRPELEQPALPLAPPVTVQQTPLTTEDLHARLTSGIPAIFGKQADLLSNKLFTAGVTLSAFEKSMLDKGLDLDTLGQRVEVLQQKLGTNTDIYPDLSSRLERHAEKILSASLLGKVMNDKGKELHDFFLIGRKGVDGQKGLGRLEGQDGHKALIVLAQRLNEPNILDKLADSQVKATAEKMGDFGKYDDLCADLCKLGFNAKGGGGMFGNAIDRDKVSELKDELEPFTDIAKRIPHDVAANFSPAEQSLLDTLKNAGIDPEAGGLEALQENLKGYSKYKQEIAALPEQLAISIEHLRKERDGATTELENWLKVDEYRSFLEKTARSELIKREIPVDKTKPEFEVFNANGAEVQLNPQATKQLIDAFNVFIDNGHLSKTDDAIHLWSANAFLPKPGTAKVMERLDGNSIQSDNSKFVAVLGETLPLAVDANVNIKNFYDALKQHEAVAISQKTYEDKVVQEYEGYTDKAGSKHEGYFDKANKLLDEGFMGKLNEQLNKPTQKPDLMALVKLQRAAIG